MLFKLFVLVLVVIYVEDMKWVLMLQWCDDFVFWQLVIGSLEVGEIVLQVVVCEVKEEVVIDVVCE